MRQRFNRFIRLLVSALFVVGSAYSAAHAEHPASGSHPGHPIPHQQGAQQKHHSSQKNQPSPKNQPAASADGHGAHQSLFNQPPERAKQVNVRLEEVTLVNQDSVKQKFASEVVGDKLVALSIFYSSCTTVCPVVAAVFAEVQQKISEGLGQDVALVFVSVDPTTDTPRRLKAYSKKHNAQPGWIWLTGEKLAVDRVLNGLGLYTPDFTEHPLTVLVGDERRGEWKRFYGFPSPDLIVGELDRLRRARHQ